MATLRALRALLLTTAMLIGPVASSAAAGPISPAAAPKAPVDKAAKARANLTYWINRVDPKRTVRWTIGSRYILGNHDGVAIPWENRIELSTIYVGDNASWAKYMVLHEWAHILQYRAYGKQWGYATMNAGLLMPGTKPADAIEHQADCIYYALGGTTVSRGMYGCPNNLPLRASARRIAAKEDMRKREGWLDKLTVQGRRITVQGWIGDLSVVNSRPGFRVYVDGKAATTGTTNQRRVDVNNRMGYADLHGFSTRFDVAPGLRRVCLESADFSGNSRKAVRCVNVRVK